MVESQLHTLRQSLAQAGVSLGKLDVRRESQGEQDAWRQPESQPGGGRAASAMTKSDAQEEPEESAVLPGRIDVVA
jgi:flagellar hook-length control protein FliK